MAGGHGICHVPRRRRTCAPRKHDAVRGNVAPGAGYAEFSEENVLRVGRSLGNAAQLLHTDELMARLLPSAPGTR